MPLIPPNDKAKRVGDYLRVVVILQFILSIVYFMVISWLTGIFDIIGALIGYMAIKNPEGYNFQAIICYTFFCGMEFIWAVVRMIMYFTNGLEETPSAAWQEYMFVGAIVAGPIIYFLASYLAYRLYNELRSMMLDPSSLPGDDGGFGGGGGGAGYYGGHSQQPQQNMWRHPEVHPPAAASAPAQPSGFVPFRGQGHKLGGN